MSSSDSDSEDDRLREAVDPEFNTKKNVDSDKKKEQSLRRDKVKNGHDDGDHVSDSRLSVTKGFQEHVAKKLSESIEK